MINRTRLLADLQTLVRKVEADLQERVTAPHRPEIAAALQTDYTTAKTAHRTAQTFNQWVTDYQTQIAVAWVLSATFARFLEDNALVSPPRLAGTPAPTPTPDTASTQSPQTPATEASRDNLQRARNEHEAYFQQHPTATDREYLLWVFDSLAQLPGAAEIFGPTNLIWALPEWLSGDAAGEILTWFQRIDPNTGTLVHDFTDPDWDTRFLGDLYQDLSEAARKKYALLQTPLFVEQFILDRTLDPAIDTFGLAGLRMIDPACGSGHFLLGAFDRLLDRWLRQEPGTPIEELARRALASVHGVDINPFAVAIARFRLLLAAMKATHLTALSHARAFPLQVACGDSLIHGDWHQLVIDGVDPQTHTYAIEDIQVLMRLLAPGHYHAVVANPPYIVPKDKAANDAYRQRYRTCHRKYSLAVPFLERIFQLAIPGGFTGQITANSFMKREFGKKLIEDFFPTVDLTHVIDTSGAYIPGHGTPTVILLGRNRPPMASQIRTVMGIRGEPSTPTDPTQGVVWTAIVNQIDIEGSESEFVSSADSQRELFHKHPWSIGGGGASELKDYLNKVSRAGLGEVIESIGFLAITGEDEIFVLPDHVTNRQKILNKPFCTGDLIRDWNIEKENVVIFPYDKSDPKMPSFPYEKAIILTQYLWRHRTHLKIRNMFGKTISEYGLRWYEYIQFIRDRSQSYYLIAFAEVTTHNHFVLDRGGKVFKQTAPVIKLPATATEDDHLALLGLLNSSTACFWMKQVTQIKTQVTGMDAASWRLRRAFDGTKLKQLPITEIKPLDLAKELDTYAQKLKSYSPEFCLTKHQDNLIESMSYAKDERLAIIASMIALQEELDWRCYQLYKLIDIDLTYPKDPPPIQFGERAFEICMARQIAAGELETTWFEWHNSTPITELPEHWPEGYRQLVERRIEWIETDKNIGLIEQPEYKRRWETKPWESQLERALQTWLLNRLEQYFDLDGRMGLHSPTAADQGAFEPSPEPKLPTPALISLVKLADWARHDPEFMQVAALYTHDPSIEVLPLVASLVEPESVPLLPNLRYKPSGLRKRQDWEQTWALQRQEDAIDARSQLAKDHPDYLDSSAAQRLKAAQIGEIPVPPKYASSDFLKPHYWKLRGKLDVPKERWVSFPHCAGPDGQLVIAWAGYDPLQLALAISTYFVYIKEEVGGSDDPRLIPLLASLLELLPWLYQWHNHLDPTYGLRMGDYIDGFVQDEARQLRLSLDHIRAWQPPATPGRSQRKAR